MDKSKTHIIFATIHALGIYIYPGIYMYIYIYPGMITDSLYYLLFWSKVKLQGVVLVWGSTPVYQTWRSPAYETPVWGFLRWRLFAWWQVEFCLPLKYQKWQSEKNQSAEYTVNVLHLAVNSSWRLWQKAATCISKSSTLLNLI